MRAYSNVSLSVLRASSKSLHLISEIKSEATWIFTNVLNTSTEVSSHSTVNRRVSGLEMGLLMRSIVLSK